MTIKRLFTLFITICLCLGCFTTAWMEEATEEPIPVHIVSAHFGWAAPPSDNLVRRELAKRIGVDLIYEAIHYNSTDEYRKQLNMWAASGDLPGDVFFATNDVFDVTLFNSMGLKGLVYELDPYIEEHENFRDFVKGVLPKVRSQYDGKVYGYPYHINDPENVKVRDGMVALRYDWMQKLNAEYPTNPEEYYELLVRMRDEIEGPDGKTIIGLSLGEDMAGIGYLGAQFVGKYGANLWEQNEEGTWVIPMYSNEAQMQKFVAFMNKLWTEGLMDKEAFTNRHEQLLERCSSSLVASTPSLRHNVMAEINDALQREDPEALFVYIPSFPDESIERANTQGRSFYGSGFAVINKKASEETVEAYFKACDYVLTEEGTKLTARGVEGEQWVLNDEGLIEYTPEYQEYYSKEDNVLGDGLWTLQQIAGDYFRIDKFSVPNPIYSRPDYSISQGNMNDDWVMDDLVYAVFPGEIEQSKLPVIDDAHTQLLVQAIMAADEAEALSIYATWPETAKKLGYDEIIAERNELVSNLSVE